MLDRAWPIRAVSAMPVFDTLLLLDGDRKIIWGNQPAWVMFGPAENAVGQTFIGLVHDYELNQAVLDATSGGRSIGAADRWLTAERYASARCPCLNRRRGRRDRGCHRAPTARAARDAILSPTYRTSCAPRLPTSTSLLRPSKTAQRESRLDAADVGAVSGAGAGAQSTEPRDDRPRADRVGASVAEAVPAPVEPLVGRAVANLLPQATLKSQHLSRMVPEKIWSR